MTDRLDEAFGALARVDAPISWDDVVQRDDGGIDDDADLSDTSDGTARGTRTSRRRFVAVAAVAAALVAVVIFAVRADVKPDRTGVLVPNSVPPTTPAPTRATPTTHAATSSARVFPVTAWTGNAYLVWSGEDGNTQKTRADGWSYDPATQQTTNIPTAPIGARTEAVGVWTGKELIVCCGSGDDTATAASYRPDLGTWRRLADPPEGADDVFAAAVWTGDQMIVVGGFKADRHGTSSAPHTFGYDPPSDHWRRLADPPPSLGRIPEAVWTGREVVVWSAEDLGREGGYQYDPARNEWTALPDVPAASATNRGSIAWTGDELILYGVSASDDTRVAGARWRPSDTVWSPLRDPGLPPIQPYEGTPGSQSLTWDDTTRRLVVWPAHGNEFPRDSIPLLTYDPATQTWQRRGEKELGYHPQLAAGNGIVFGPDRDQPVVERLVP